ncbi:MAG: hypothetical protein J6M60_00560 [Clostridia bacterium]|nr:hypothetical protein [Clostridia bacterium]
MFLGKYKMMLGSDAKKIYGSKDYYRKRLKVLENERYIKRLNRMYIKLDDKGTKIVKEFGYDYSFNCRKKEYMDRINEIAKIAALTINSNIDFMASWSIKDNNIYTQTSRKYIGKLKYQDKVRVAYYISKTRKTIYMSQVINDINKVLDYNDIIIFLENMNLLNNNQKLIFGKESTLIIKPTQDNLEIMRYLHNIDLFQIAEKIYKDKEVLLSNWKKADYMLNDKTYIFVMPFIDTEKLNRLNIFFRNNRETIRKIDIITLKENKDKINEILTKKVNIIELDNFLGGINEGDVKKI